MICHIAAVEWFVFPCKNTKEKRKDGFWLLAVGFWLLAFGCWLWLLADGSFEPGASEN